MVRSLLVICFVIFYGCSGNGRKDPAVADKTRKDGDELIIFHAGSLSIPFKELADSFRSLYPGTKILMESAGSVASARKITDLHKPCDIFASADYKIIEDMLIPDHTRWYIPFASNEMTIVYSENSRKNRQITQENWYKILLDKEVIYGRSDPNSDPCGYRAILTIRLSEQVYGIEGLTDRFLEKDNRYIRPKEVDLLALLETGTVDYIFLYRSVAEQHDLNYLVLPPEINLSDRKHAGRYSTVSCEIRGKQPGEKTVIYGEPMIYGVTILEDSPNRKLAEEFLLFLLDAKRGQLIMQRNGQPSVVPFPTATYDQVPLRFQEYVTREERQK